MESELLAAVDFRVCKRLVVGNFGNWLGTRDAWTLKISVLTQRGWVNLRNGIVIVILGGGMDRAG